MVFITPLRVHQPQRRWLYREVMAPQAKVGDQPVNVRLPRELHEEILERAKAEDRTLAQTIRVALRYYLNKTEPLT
jgi:predicted HicB family RNase H-like nuclease